MTSERKADDVGFVGDGSLFFGVNLGGGRGKNTAVAVLRAQEGRAVVEFASARTPGGKPWFDEPLTEFILHEKPRVVAVDAPLTLPACVRCRLTSCPGISRCADPAVAWLRDHRPPRSGKPGFSPYTQRVTDIVAVDSAMGSPPHRETLGTATGPLTARMQHLERVWTGYVRDRNLIEVWPRAAVSALVGGAWAEAYSRSPDAWGVRAQVLEALVPVLEFRIWREGVLGNVHLFEAVVCGVMAYLWDQEQWRIPEEFQGIAALDGWIWMPHKPGADRDS